MNARIRMAHSIVAVALLAAAGGWVAPVAGAAGTSAAVPVPAAAPESSDSITVTVPEDQWDSPNPDNAGKGCSLREALELVYLGGERGCGKDVPAAENITIKIPPGTYILTNSEPLPEINSGRTINISGPGVVIDGGYAFDVRYEGIFLVDGGWLNLKDLTLQNGNRPGGGAIWLQHGTVTADHVVFENNQAVANATPGQSGGAILVDTGNITVSNSYFGNNVAVYGGGAVSTPFGYFFHDIFYDNRAGRGGAFYDSGGNTEVIIEQSKFEDNKSRPQPLDPPASGYESYSDKYGGGAISNYGKLSVYRSVLKDNHTELDKGGGAVDNHGAMLMSECVLTGNTAVAHGSGDSNSFIQYAFGGAIINYGTLDLVRCSIHGNQADYAGAILNYGAGHLSLYNSTVSNNTAEQFYGGLANDLPDNLFKSFSPGAELRLVHTTVGKNNAGAAIGLLGNQLYSQYLESIWLANSIVATGCNMTVYSQGGSVTSDFCDSIADPLTTPSANKVLSMSASLNLEPLQPGNATLPEFMVQPIKSNSSAAGIGVDGPYNCNDPHILHRDQNLAPRPNPCAAGAIQTSSIPAKFDSVPGPGLVTFPWVDFEAGQTHQETTVLLKNVGGGAMNYTVQNENLSALGSYVVNLQQLPSGTLYAGQQTPLTFTCTPPAAGDFWQNISILTDAPNRKRASYKFRCTGVGRTRQASMSSQPGAFNQPQPHLGQTAHSTLTVNNPGPSQENLTASAAWANPGAMWGAPQMLEASDLSSPAASIPPGGSVNFDVACTPPAFGTYVNTLVITTDDPNNPTINYDVACEALVDSPPEDLQPQTALATGIPMEGVAVSPDGQEVLAGGVTDNHLRYFARNTDTGALTPFSYLAVTGMSGIFGVAFSHDNQNVYYTAQNGNGLITARGVGVALSVTDVITPGTLDRPCGGFLFCPNNTLYGPRGVVVSPDDQYVYVAGFFSGTLTVFSRDLDDGALSYVQAFTRTIGGVNLLGGATRITTSPDGAFVYVLAQTDDAVVVFQRDAVTGRLSYQTAYKNGLGGLTHLHTPTDLALSPDGSFLYVAATNSNAVNTFSRSSADGGLSLTAVLTVTGPWGVAVSPDVDGRRLYLANYGSNTVQVYGRDPVSGTLSFVNGFTQNATGPVFIATSLDDQDIYVTQYDGTAIQQFQTIENAPVLSHISPASALVGSGAVTLTVAGGRFYPDSQIVWNGAAQATTFVDEHTLQSVIPGSLFNAVGSPPVLVHNPRALNTGNSSSQTFVIAPPAQPPVPSISSTNPPEADFGGSDLLVFVYGANFLQDAVVYYNHHALPTTFISSQTLQIVLSADILAQPGDGGLEVVNGGGAPAELDDPSLPDVSKSSTIVSFKISAPGLPARPALSSLAPASVLSGTAPVWVLVRGDNFSTDPANQSVGRWNGQARSSIVVDANNLLMQLTSQDLAAAGTAEVTVLTAGRGESSPLAFRVRAANEKPVPVVTSALLLASTLVINGSDFVVGAQARLNGAARATTFVNSYQLRVAITAADNHHGVTVTVTNPGPGGGVSNAVVTYIGHLFLPIAER